MRVLILSLALSLLPLLPAQGQSLMGLELGMPLGEAETHLESNGRSIQRFDDSYAYISETKANPHLVTVAAIKEGEPSRSNASVDELSVSLYVRDASPAEVAQLYNEYRKAWSESLGKIDPNKRGNSLIWTWETDSVEATIHYTEYQGQADMVSLRLSRP